MSSKSTPSCSLPGLFTQLSLEKGEKKTLKQQMKEEEERERESENQTSLSHSVITSSRLRLNRRDITVSDSLCGLTKTLSRRQLLLPLLSVMEAVETKHNVLHVILLLPRSRCLRMSRRRNINQKNYRNCRECWGGETPNMLFWFFLQTLILAVVQIKTLISLHSRQFLCPIRNQTEPRRQIRASP